jgi:hypothetical protein
MVTYFVQFSEQRLFSNSGERFWARSQNYEKRQLASYCMCVRLSARNNSGSHRKDFREIWRFNIVRKYVEKIQVPFKADKNKGYFTWRSISISDHISLNYSQNEKYFIKKDCNENKTHNLCSIIFFRISRRLWGKTEKYCRASHGRQYNIEHSHGKLDTWSYKWTLRIWNTYCFSMWCYNYAICIIYNGHENCLLCGTNWTWYTI